LTKELNIIVGGNGSGKSTFYYHFLQQHGLPFLNADELAKARWPADPEAHSYEAAKEVEETRKLYVSLGKSFCFETVFSHPSKVDFLALAKSNNYTVNLFVIHIEGDPATNVARVANRQTQGGHGVPEDKIKGRIPRTLNHIALAIPLCDTVSFYDNTSSSHPFVPLAVLQVSQTLYSKNTLPQWLIKCIKGHYSLRLPLGN